MQMDILPGSVSIRDLPIREHTKEISGRTVELQLGTADFSNETASGWQQVMFSSPVPVVANTPYVGSILLQ